MAKKTVLCDPMVSRNYRKHFRRLGFVPFERGVPDIYLPAGRGGVNRMREAIEKDLAEHYMQVPEARSVSAKDLFWRSMVECHGTQKVLDYLPPTYLIDSPEDVQRLRERITDQPDLMIAKGRKQRRRSLRLFVADQLEEILTDESFVVVQEMIDTRGIIGEEPFNIRTYFMLTLKEGVLEGAFVPEGKIIYSPCASEWITDQKVRPKGKPALLSDIVDNPTYSLDRDQFTTQATCMFRSVMDCLKQQLGDQCQAWNKLACAQLFGVDLVLNRAGQLRMLEFNFSPDMKIHHSFEKKLKQNLFHDWVCHFAMGDAPQKLSWNFILA